MKNLNLVLGLVAGIQSSVIPAPTLGADFRLISRDAQTAHVLDASAVRHERDGARSIDFWGAASVPGGDPPALYLKMTYAFDCQHRRIRGEGLQAFDRSFGLVFDNPQRSPWHEVPSGQSMPQVYNIACSRGGGAAGLSLHAQSMREALQMVRSKLGWAR